jgi:CRISPR locus-related DNA-binding protein
MNVIIATVGEEPAGIVESIKRYPCDKLILFTDKRGMKNAMPKIMKIAEALNIETETILVDPYDTLGMIDLIKAKILEQHDAGMILNVTGGRKTMAIAAAFAGMVMGDKVKDIIYITEEKHKIVSLPRLLNPDSLLTNEKRRILQTLKERREATAEELKAGSKMQAVWKHLRELERLGYITSSKGKPRKFKLTLSGRLLV